VALRIPLTIRVGMPVRLGQTVIGRIAVLFYPRQGRRALGQSMRRRGQIRGVVAVGRARLMILGVVVVAHRVRRAFGRSCRVWLVPISTGGL
jgi:hypothetical protein